MTISSDGQTSSIHYFTFTGDSGTSTSSAIKLCSNCKYKDNCPFLNNNSISASATENRIYNCEYYAKEV